jgi:hypothetical protein
MKGKKKGKYFIIFCAGHDEERQNKEQVLFEPIPKKI